MDETYVPDPDAAQIDFATAIRAAKARRAENASHENGYVPVQRPVAPKAMTIEDRTANDLALLKRQQMFPKSRKPKVEDVNPPKEGDAPPLKVTRPLKTSCTLEAEPKSIRITKFSNQGCISEETALGSLIEIEAASRASKEGNALSFEDDTKP